MTAPLKVLIVEDSQDDAELMLAELRRGGFDPKWERVETEPDYLRELDRGPDLILSDYSLPEFDGLRAVDLLRGRGLDIPFLLVTGTLGEERAVEAMRHGVTDYLLKDRIGRLGQAVGNALAQMRLRAEHKRMEAQLALQAAALETAANGILITDRAGTILWVNPAFTALTGYTVEEVNGKNPRLLKSGKHDPKFYQDFWQTIASGKVWRGEFVNRRKDGRICCDEHTVTPVRLESGRITHFVGIMNDVSARRQAEEELRLTHAKLRQLLAHSPAVIYTLSLKGGIPAPTVVSDNIERFLGVTVAESLRPGWWLESLHPEERDRVVAATLGAWTGSGYSLEYRIRHKDGSYRWVEDSNRVVRDAHGNPMEAVGAWADITGRKRTEHRVAAFSRLVQKLNATKTAREAGELIVDLADQLFGWDACVLNLYSPEKDQIHSVINRDTINGQRVDVPAVYSGTAPSPRARQVIEHGAQLVLREEPYAISDGIPFGDTTRLSASLIYVPIRDGDRITGLLSIQSYKPKAYTPEDLAALQAMADLCGGALNRIQATESLKESEARYRSLVEESPDAIGIYQEDKLIFANSTGIRMLGAKSKEELLDRKAEQMIHSEDLPGALDRVRRRLAGETGMYPAELRYVRLDGSTLPVEVIASPITFAGAPAVQFIARDISARKRLEEQFIQAQKMEGVGQLAGGVAHDFNNILAVILGYTDILRQELKSEGSLRAFIEEIRQAAERATALTRQLLVFSRKQTLEPVVLDPNDVLAEISKMLRRLVDESIELTLQPGRKIGRVKADSGYLGQVLINLVVNARDAMPGGGRLTIETANATLDEHYAATHAGVTPGEYVMFAVSDTGTGMTEEVKAHVFEAFFTTKPKGKGTGLGLATCQTIVHQCGGHIGLYTELGRGTTFKVYLPRVDLPLAHDTAFIKNGPLPRGQETILLVEDEPSLRHLAAKILSAQGYTVLSANSGQDGLRVAREHQGPPIRLVVTDVVMPEMSGNVMAEWLTATYPQLKVLFTSGYTDAAIAHHGVLDPGVAFLSKPYTPMALACKVREVLDEINPV